MWILSFPIYKKNSVLKISTFEKKFLHKLLSNGVENKQTNGKKSGHNSFYNASKKFKYSEEKCLNSKRAQTSKGSPQRSFKHQKRILQKFL